MKFPSPPQRGQSVADTINDILRWMRSENVVGISGGRIKCSPNGKTIVLDRVPSSSITTGGRFIVSYSSDDSKLRVSPGLVFVGKTNSDRQFVRPSEPTIGAVPLSGGPAIDVSGKTPGVAYNVWCIIHNYYTHKIELHLDSETPEIDEQSNAVLLASITWDLSGGALVIDSLVQHWESDIGWFHGDVDDSSSGSHSDDSDDSGWSDGSDTSGGGSETSGDPHSSDDPDSSGGGGDPDNSDDSSDDDSSDESSSSCGQEFPLISDFTAELIRVDGSFDTSCLMEDGTNSPVLRPVTYRLTATLQTGAPGDCNVDIIFKIGGRGTSQVVGNALGEGDYVADVTFNAFPCAEYTASVQMVARASGGNGLGSCCLNGESALLTEVVTTPGLCSNFGACE